MSADALITPPKFSADGVEDDEFVIERSLDEARSIFAEAGYPTTNEEAAHIQQILST